MERELFSYIGFSHFFGIGPLHFKALLAVFKTAAQSYTAPPAALEEILGPSLARRFTRFRQQTDLFRLYSDIVGKGITVLTQNDKRYPKSLASLTDAPICLYIKGDCSLLQEEKQLFAIVGTRNPTAYGAQLARHFASSLVEHDFIIVSGMALGIDALAHWGALEGKGKTIAVLGCGVDIVYPPSHRTLYQKIVAAGGTVISEFPPGHTVRRGLFVVRNRLISGLSCGLLVVEGTDKSGTLTTAKYAAEQGKMVFAPPVPITSYVSQAPNLLLKQGAVLVTEVADILHEFGLKERKRISINTDDFSTDEKNIVGLLRKEDCSFDGLVMALCLPSFTVSTALSRLELLNVVEKDDAGNYRLHLG